MTINANACRARRDAFVLQYLVQTRPYVTRVYALFFLFNRQRRGFTALSLFLVLITTRIRSEAAMIPAC